MYHPVATWLLPRPGSPPSYPPGPPIAASPWAAATASHYEYEYDYGPLGLPYTERLKWRIKNRTKELENLESLAGLLRSREAAKRAAGLAMILKWGHKMMWLRRIGDSIDLVLLLGGHNPNSAAGPAWDTPLEGRFADCTATVESFIHMIEAWATTSIRNAAISAVPGISSADAGTWTRHRLASLRRLIDFMRKEAEKAKMEAKEWHEREKSKR